MIRLALRFDDPSATSNRALEEGILAAARAADIPLTLAVIPFKKRTGGLVRLTEAGAAHLIQANRDGIIEIAQHGYCHELEKVGQQLRSEFAGMDPDRQLKTIRVGRSVLEELFGKTITGFVPPWNTFDAATTRALAQAGFRYLSAGGTLDINCACSLLYLPATVQMLKLEATLDALGPFASFDPVVIAIMHHFDFVENGSPEAPIDLKRFGALLQRLSRRAELAVSTVSMLADSPCSSLTSRLRQNAWDGLHWRIQRLLPDAGLFDQAWPRLIIHSCFHSK